MTCRAKSWTARPIEGPRSKAFTLLELVVVLALLAIVAVALSMSLRQPLQNARLERALASLEDVDRRARIEARKSSSIVELRINSNGEVLQQTLSTGEPRRIQQILALDGGIRIERFLTPGADAIEGELFVRISPSGQSDTYAVCLRAGDQRKIWLLVVGATGQTMRTTEDSTVERLVSY